MFMKDIGLESFPPPLFLISVFVLRFFFQDTWAHKTSWKVFFLSVLWKNFYKISDFFFKYLIEFTSEIHLCLEFSC